MKKLYSLFTLLVFCILQSQVGINTSYPSTNSVLHIDAKKDNVAVPTVAQSTDDVTIAKNDGSLYVGGIVGAVPTAKVEINSSIANTSGLRLRNLTSTSPVNYSTPRTFLAIDDLGNVVIADVDLDRNLTTIQNNITNYNSVVKNNDGTSNATLTSFTFNKTATDSHSATNPYRPSRVVPGSSVSFTIPAGKARAVFMNFMMGFELSRTGDANANGAEAFGAEIIFLDAVGNVAATTGVTQTTQVPSGMPTRQMYSVNYSTNLAPGTYFVGIRINTIRFLYGGAASNTVKAITFKPIQYSYNISYFNS